MKRALRLALATLTILTTSFAGQVLAHAQAEAPAPLRIAITQNDKNWTPYTYQTGYPGYNVLTLMYDTLLWHDKDNKIIPWLASDYTVRPDGLAVDVTLRNGVRWHDGRPLTVDDVKFTYDYIQEFNHGRFTPEVADVIESTVITGPSTVTFRLSKPSAGFATAPLADVTILPKHIWENIREPYPSAKGEQGLAIGSGPYKMVAYDVDQRYRLEANPDYFMGPPTVPAIELPIIPDANAQVLALRGGEVDAVAQNLPPELVGGLADAAGIEVATGPDYTTTAITMNTERAPFDQVEFRQAVAYAIDVDGLVNSVLAGVGTPGSPGYIHPKSPFYKQGLRHRFDLAKANAMLDELGFTERNGEGVRSGGGITLDFEILANSGNPIEVRTAEVVSSMLARAGIKATVVALTSSAKSARTGGFGGQTPDRDFDFNMSGATAPVQDDPDRIRTILASWNPAFPNLNSGKWSNARFDELLALQSTELDRAKRLPLIAEMQSIIARERPNVVLYYRDGGYAYRPDAYDNWVYVKGKGILDKVSFVRAAQQQARPTAGGQDGGSNAGVITAVVVGGVVIVGVGLLLVRRRRVGRAEQE